jgi:hypothetical protein
MIQQGTFDSSALPADTDFVGIGYNAVIILPTFELAQFVLGALKTSQVCM